MVVREGLIGQINRFPEAVYGSGKLALLVQHRTQAVVILFLQGYGNRCPDGTRSLLLYLGDLRALQAETAHEPLLAKKEGVRV
jgi:hypothetical protein